ncbi:DUF1289 domain-containing protein [Arenibaculum pallidiluteum]|uniref:DUF1289 domain-containing protein n=1 Tax=Arenibaculum pallidiluteum TaxID=2812559 RepID=UPI001A96BE8F|nr:DUF1289 domain-containing protein [Arenibaculum pallidiluteum]
MKASADTSSPCVKRCGFEGGLCRGCLRTRAEVKGWKQLPDERKAEINARVRTEIAAVAGVREMRKLDKRIRKLEAKLEALRDKRAAIAGTSADARIRLVAG